MTPPPAFIAIPGQFFASHQMWVIKASSWLTSHPEYRNTEHPKKKGWQGSHFTALCFDQKGRRCRNGYDMQLAHDEGAFPVWWVWPDQIAALLMPPQEGVADSPSDSDKVGQSDGHPTDATLNT
jgi:hypothetical protein